RLVALRACFLALGNPKGLTLSVRPFFRGGVQSSGADAFTELRPRGLAPARPPAARPRGPGPSASGLPTAGARRPRLARRARRARDVLPARNDGGELPGPRPRDRRPRARARIARIRARPRSRADERGAPGRPRAEHRDHLACDRAATERLPRAGVLDQPADAVGLRRSLRARVPIRLG